MKTAQEHVKASNRVLRLSEEQQQNPMTVFEDFFTNYHLKDARELFEEWLQAGLKHRYGLFNDPLQRSNLIFFREKLEELLEAGYILQSTYETKTNLKTEHSLLESQLYAVLTSKQPL